MLRIAMDASETRLNRSNVQSKKVKNSRVCDNGLKITAILLFMCSKTKSSYLHSSSFHLLLYSVHAGLVNNKHQDGAVTWYNPVARSDTCGTFCSSAL